METFEAGKDEENEIEKILSSLQKDLSDQGFMIEARNLRYLTECGLAYDRVGLVSHEEPAKCEWAVLFPLNLPHSLAWNIREHKTACSIEKNSCEKAA